MGGLKRFYYPGGNTAEGFFSYYDNILPQEKANRIFCMKGGPGTGKSTFMKKIGELMEEKGFSVDYLLCSSDPDSLDGILIKEKNIAVIDGTSPHVVDPKTPGAVDKIINLGEFWNEEEIRKNREEIMLVNDNIKRCYDNAYKYIKAAGLVYKGIEEMYSMALRKEELYKNTAGLIYRELSHKELSNVMGNVKRQFAGAITPKGLRNTIDSLISGYENIYILKSPVGFNSNILLENFRENALNRGLDVESFYCPLDPSNRLEHILIPEISTAFVTSNDYHPVKTVSASVIDMRLYIDYEMLEKYKNMISGSLDQLKALLELAVDCLRDAKGSHDVLEELYIPNMYFDKINEKREEVVEEILKS